MAYGSGLWLTSRFRSLRTSRAWMVRWTSCTRAAFWSGTFTWISAAGPIAPPSRPVSAIVRSPRARAACSASEHVGRLAAGRDPERDVPRLAERLDLPHEHLFERVVVGDARQDARIHRQRDRRQRDPFLLKPSHQLRRRSAARPRRCRRCRTPAASGPPSTRRPSPAPPPASVPGSPAPARAGRRLPRTPGRPAANGRGPPPA